MDIIPGFNEWWNYWQNYWQYFNRYLASSESARRYYGTKQFMLKGVPNVFSPFKTLEDRRFLDPVNTWYLYTNEPLKSSLEKFAKFPIATSYQNNEPRLLLVSVDVQEGSTVIFDSYEKEDGTRKTEYGNYRPEGFEHVIRHNDGIEVDFVLASGSVPVNYDFTKIFVEDSNGWNGIKSENENKNEDENKKKIVNDGNGVTTKRVRYFWDGGIIANTPLREAVIEHRRYWQSVRKSEVPPLRAFIVNVHPIKQDSLPADYDAVIDRKNDLTYHDRTLFDERMAIVISDYVNIVNSLIKLAEDSKVAQALVDNILDKQAETRNFSTGKRFNYRGLVENMVNVEQVIRIERKNDTHTIANKTFDFSRTTIRQLIRDGYEETLDQETKILKVWDSEHQR